MNFENRSNAATKNKFDVAWVEDAQFVEIKQVEKDFIGRK